MIFTTKKLTAQEMVDRGINRAIYINKYVFSFLGLILIVFMGITGHKEALAKKINCDSFMTQSDAQKTFDSNRRLYHRLDSDGDAVACEQLK